MIRLLWLALAAAALSGCVAQPATTSDRPSPNASSATPLGSEDPGQESTWNTPPNLGWDYQLQGAPATDAAQVLDVDPAEVPADFASQVHSEGGYAICYFNAGGWEDWRSDADRFPSSIIGEPLDGWEGENWLDIRQLSVLMPILEARMDLCANRGFDAVEPDNVDGYLHDTGFELTQADSEALVQALATAAHERGLAIGLKNGIELLPTVGETVDFAVNEECVAYEECDAYAPFISTGKPVFHVEYEGSKDRVCAATPAGFQTIIKNLDLGPSGSSCP